MAAQFPEESSRSSDGIERTIAGYPATLHARLSAQYIGRAGIHGIGFTNKKEICVYAGSAIPEELQRDVQQAAYPYTVQYVEEPIPKTKG